MTNFILLVAMGTSLSLQSCNQSDSSAYGLTNHHSKSNIEITIENQEKSSSNTSKLSVLYEDYIGIKNSLSKDQPDSAKYFAGLLLTNLELLNTTDLTPEQLTLWNKNKLKIKESSKRIKEASGLELQREQFMTLSLNLFTLIKSFKDNSAPVYYQFCPMANNGKGAYWLSEQSKISNPYYGKKMLSCGSTKETITP